MTVVGSGVWQLLYMVVDRLLDLDLLLGTCGRCALQGERVCVLWGNAVGQQLQGPSAWLLQGPAAQGTGM